MVSGNADDTNLGAQAIYNNDVSNLADYGRLYNWYAVDDARGLCPSGWHVPTDGEFMTLEMELGMSESEANGTGSRHRPRHQMKSSPEDSPSWNGTNTSGFSGLAGGSRTTMAASRWRHAAVISGRLRRTELRLVPFTGGGNTESIGHYNTNGTVFQFVAFGIKSVGCIKDTEE